MPSISHLDEFYGLLGELESRLGGKRLLQECSGRMEWPGRGVYFFFEDGERRGAPGAGSRVVRVGTHTGRTTTLWSRLSKHKGNRAGGGRHRTSRFRLLVGDALRRRDHPGRFEAWGLKGQELETFLEGAGLDMDALHEQEEPMERAVSRHIGGMPFLWVGVNDGPGRGSDRDVIERNAIGLLGAPGHIRADPPSPSWLGRHCAARTVSGSGMWNVDCVDAGFAPGFFDVLRGTMKRNHRQPLHEA